MNLTAKYVRSFPRALRSALVCALLAAAGCGDPRLYLRPAYVSTDRDVIDFGEVEIGVSEQRIVTVINKGDRSLKVLQFRGELLDVFAVDLEEGVVEGQSDLKVRVFFSPVQIGDFETTIVLENDSVNQPELPIVLKGTGVARNPCRDLVCSSPPASRCIDSVTSRRHDPSGACVDGVCQYEAVEEDCSTFGCNYDTGRCRANPCSGVACNSPPGTQCISQKRSRTYDPAGTCVDGECVYRPLEENCAEFGCDMASGLCKEDPCIGVTCNEPPNGCFLPVGSCSKGTCTYTTAPEIACDDGDVCTADDVCRQGVCGGTRKTCSTPPQAYCTAADKLRRYEPVGACNAQGDCVYIPQEVYCAHGCDNGVCRNDPCPGGCNDNNPCTEDVCTPNGCVYQASSSTNGNYCSTGSAVCPNGRCGGGSCQVITGEVCQTKVEMDLCSSAQVAGVCTGAGKCVVQNVPPQYQCPGCNGFCLKCFIFQYCFPL